MNINSLLEMTQSLSSKGDITMNLMKSKTSSTQFNEMFGNIMNDSRQNVLDPNYNNNVKTNEASEEINQVSNSNEVINDEDIENENKVDFTKLDKDENEDETLEVSKEVFGMILNMFKDNDIDIKEYFDVNEDGLYEFNVEKLPELKLEIQNFIQDNNIDIDLTILDQDESFDFDAILNTTMNFISDEANEEVKFLNIFTKDDTNIIEFTNDKDITIQEMIPKDEVKENKDYLTVSPEDLEPIVAESLNEVKETEDNFEILKNTINEMVDNVEVVETKEEVTPEIKLDVNVNVNDDDKIVAESEEVVETVKETDLEETEVVKEVNTEEPTEKVFHKEHKNKNKNENVNVKTVKNEFTFDNVEEKEIDTFKYKDLVKENNLSHSISDKYIETINVAKQMVKGMELKLSEGTQEMSIKLDPENLGKVNLKIITENGLVTAKFEAESQKVKEIIESNLSLLKESLEKRGVEVSNLDVSVGQNMNNEQNRNDIDYLRKVLKEKNPHKILGKTIKNYINTAEINNNEIKKRGLFMQKSKINYIA